MTNEGFKKIGKETLSGYVLELSTPLPGRGIKLSSGTNTLKGGVARSTGLG